MRFAFSLCLVFVVAQSTLAETPSSSRAPGRHQKKSIWNASIMRSVRSAFGVETTNPEVQVQLVRYTGPITPKRPETIRPHEEKVPTRADALTPTTPVPEPVSVPEPEPERETEVVAATLSLSTVSSVALVNAISETNDDEGTVALTGDPESTVYIEAFSNTPVAPPPLPQWVPIPTLENGE